MIQSRRPSLCDRHAEVAKRSEALTAAVRWLRRGIRCVEPLHEGEARAWRARLRSNLGGVRARQARWAEAISTCQQAIVEAESLGELRALAHACYILDWALVESGRAVEATHSWRALEVYQQLGDPEHESKVLNNLGGLAYWDGRWDDAIALYRQAGEASERAGRPTDVAYTDCNVGEILSDQGRLDEAEAHLTRARRLWSGTGEGQAVAYLDVLLGRMMVRRGQSRQGIEILSAAMDELRRFKLDGYADFAQALLAEAEAFGVIRSAPWKSVAVSSRRATGSDRS